MNEDKPMVEAPVEVFEPTLTITPPKQKEQDNANQERQAEAHEEGHLG